MKLKYFLFGGDPDYEYYEEDIYSMGLIPTLFILILETALILIPCLCFIGV